MKFFFKKIFIPFILISFSVLVIACNGENKTNSFTVNYIAENGGYIAGEPNQTVTKGENGYAVTAMPDEDYYFLRWSDGVVTPERCETAVKSNIVLTAYFAKISFTLNYSASKGGRIIGNANQTVTIKEDGEEVEAVADTGYSFVKWSDGVTEPLRTHTYVRCDINVTAHFEEITKTFLYVYNSATANDTETAISLTYRNVYATRFIVPIRTYFTFDGWFLEPDFKTKVADNNGRYLLGKEFLGFTSPYLYAKWIKNEKIPYKILIVFVTKIKTTHLNWNTVQGKEVNLDYKMSSYERQFCEIIPGVIEKMLNDTFAGSVTFDVDYYFTTESLGRNEITYAFDDNYYIEAVDIPEVGPLLKNYRSVMSSFCFSSDYNYSETFHRNWRGCSGEKYAKIYLDTIFRYASVFVGDPLSDLSHPAWDDVRQLYLHEFTHSVELALGRSDYHQVIKDYDAIDLAREYEITKLFLLNLTEKDGQKTGIPAYFWTGDIEINVIYGAGLHGMLDGDVRVIRAKVPFGGTYEVTAVAKEGYRFLGWSDGVATATRKDINIISFLRVEVFFEKIE